MAKKKINDQAILKLAQDRFGYDELYPGQEEAIRAVIDGHDTLAIMPTGAGKSAIYQIAGIMLDGPTIVISPLIALQRDQADSLRERGLTVAVVNSMVSDSERSDALERIEGGKAEFAFLAPEQFNEPQLLDRLAGARPSLFVVDEAHCISQWGHDFRPEYLRLGAIIEALGHPRVLALTATASPPVREEILRRLAMKGARVVAEGFDRPNIWLGVERYPDEASKRRALLQATAEATKPGIVYAATKKHTEEIAAALVELGVHAAAYHSGLKKSEREQVQEAFMNDELEVIVATIAFGMGVDKPNVRFVFHYDVSDSLDSYYQEVGRAGRDGEPAWACLFYRPEDLGLKKFFAGQKKVADEHVAQVAQALREFDEPVHPDELSQETALSTAKVQNALSRLEEAGAVHTLATGEVMPGEALDDPAAVVEEAARVEARRQVFDRSRIEMMRSYAESYDCRREFLLNYFGEAYSPPCDLCDNCQEGLTTIEETFAPPFPLNTRVTHAEYGEGLVERYHGDRMWVLFDDYGYKMLLASQAAEEGILRAVEV